MLRRKLNNWIIVLIIFSFVVVFTGCRNELTEDSDSIENGNSLTTTEDSATEDSTTEDSTTEDSTTEDSTAEDSTTEDSTTEDSTTEDSTTEDTATEDTATEDSTTEDTATEDTATEDTATEDTATEDTATEDVISETTTITEVFVPSGSWDNSSVDNPVGGNSNAYDFKVADEIILSLTNNWQSNTLKADLNDDGFSITIDTIAEQGWWAQTNGSFSEKLITGKKYQIVISAKASEVSRFKASVNFTDSDRCVDSEILVTTEYQTFKHEFTAKDADIEPDTSIERLQLSMGNDTFEEGNISVDTTGVTFYINQLTIELVE